MAGRHVAFMLPTLGGGGAERVILTLADAFGRAGDRVDLVVLRNEGALTGAVPDTVTLVDLAAPGRLRAVAPVARYLRRAWPDAFVSSMASWNCIAAMAHKAARSPAHLMLVEHSTLSVEVRRSLGRRILPPLMRRCYRRARSVVAVGRGVADDLAAMIGYPRDRIHVIYNAVLTGAHGPRFVAEPAHPWFGDGGPPVVLGVGRLIAQKDFATLVRAFARARAERPCRLAILGEGELRPALEALVAELGLGGDVALPGFVADPLPCFARAGVFVLSSRWEGLATVLVEAMAAGARIVSTDCPSGPREVLEGGPGGPEGRIVPVADPAAMAAAILAALDDPKPGPRDLARFTADHARAAYARVLFGDGAGDAACHAHPQPLPPEAADQE